MSWLKWMHKVMGTDPEPPHEVVPTLAEREAIVLSRLEVRRAKRAIEELDAIVTMAENQLQTQADVMGRKPNREEQ